MPPTLSTPLSGGLGAYNHEKARVCCANLQNIKLGLSTGGLLKLVVKDYQWVWKSNLSMIRFCQKLHFNHAIISFRESALFRNFGKFFNFFNTASSHLFKLCYIVMWYYVIYKAFRFFECHSYALNSSVKYFYSCVIYSWVLWLCSFELHSRIFYLSYSY